MSDQRARLHPTHTVSATEASHFIQNFYLKEIHKTGIRMGQHFCNTFNVTDSDLYYAPNTNAMKLIFERYVK